MTFGRGSDVFCDSSPMLRMMPRARSVMLWAKRARKTGDVLFKVNLYVVFSSVRRTVGAISKADLVVVGDKEEEDERGREKDVEAEGREVIRIEDKEEDEEEEEEVVVVVVVGVASASGLASPSGTSPSS